jgi:hypothetical protein
MAEPPAAWHPSAAYLYTLQLDGPGLAWEYLRRNPEYVRDWMHHCVSDEADPQRWALQKFHDPSVDARNAQPDWLVYPPDAIQVHPSLDRSPRSDGFRLWRLPGHKRMEHDGSRLRMVAQLATCVLRLVLAPTIEDGAAIVYAIPAGEDSALRWEAAERTLAALDFSGTHVVTRPGRTDLTQMRSLQALDGVGAGATMKQIAAALFGLRDTKARWHAESELRAQVRYLVRRGLHLMHGGYRRLLQSGHVGKGEHDPAIDSP